MRRQWSDRSARRASSSRASERRTGCGGRGARRARGSPGSSASRNGEQDAEAVEPGRARGQTGRRRGGRNGEQDAEAVELSYHYRQLTDERRSERRTGCGGSGAGSMTSGRRTRRVVGTENRMGRQWSCSSGTLVGQCVRASERRTGCGGSGAARYGRSIGHPGLVGTENRMRRQWSWTRSANASEVRCSRNGEQDAEAVERSTRRLRRRARSSRNGEQDAEAVELGR